MNYRINKIRKPLDPLSTTKSLRISNNLKNYIEDVHSKNTP